MQKGENMRVKMKKLLRQLDKRLMFFICLTVIPVNILAILLSYVAISEARERIAVSYRTEFEIFMEKQLGNLETLDRWYAGLISENQMEFMGPAEVNEVTSIVLANEAGEALNLYGISGFFYLEEKKENGKTYMSSSSKLANPDDIQRMKAELQTKEKESGSMGKWKLTCLQERYFFLSFTTYRNYNVCIGLDFNTEAEQWLMSDHMEQCGILYSDSENQLFLRPGNAIDMFPEEAGTENITGKESWTSVSRISNEGSRIYAELFHYGRWTATPAAYLILQFIAWLGIAILALLWMLIRRQAVHPMKVLENGLQQLEQRNWAFRINERAATEDYDYIYCKFNEMAEDIQMAREQEKMLYETQLNNLKLQVNPHLLLNSLNMIYSLAQTKQYEVIQKYTMNLVEYFRYCLRENNDLVTVKAEMRFVENYLDIQKIRYPGEISSVYYMEEGIENALIPSLLIQNFVENAVKYARKSDEAIEILIYMRKEEDKLCISVNDTGEGMESDLAECLNEGKMYIDKNGDRHIGVYNCRKRLEAFYGDKTGLHISSTAGEGTQVWITLPFTVSKDEMSDLC